MNPEQILKAWRAISDNNLLDFIRKGYISIDDLEQKADNEQDHKRIKGLTKSLHQDEDALWKQAQTNDTVESYREYLQSYGDNGEHANDARKALETPLWNRAKKNDTVESYREYLQSYGDNGEHANDARRALEDKDTKEWQKVKNDPTQDTVTQYKKLFPKGLFINECAEYEEDLPWFKTKAKNTINAYKEYQQEYPEKHTEDIEKCIFDIEDEKDWKTACTNNSVDAYKKYIDDYQKDGKKVKKEQEGKHVEEAEQKINNRPGLDILLDELRDDVNKYSVGELKEKTENYVATWDDLLKVFTKDQRDAIQNYQRPANLALVNSDEMPQLPKGYTEVYFWGVRGTGKTCAIGATIGYLNCVRKSLTPMDGSNGVNYLRQLQNLFNNDGKVFSLPDRSVVGNLPLMPFDFNDEVGHSHRATLIDVAGEVFVGIYKQNNNVKLDDYEVKAIDSLKDCLKNDYNNKIHFFIVEYGNDDFLDLSQYRLPNVRKSQLMQSLVTYFAKEKIFKRSSVSMNILVTKCDRIPNNQERRTKVEEYCKRSTWASVVNGINDISVSAHCGGLNVCGFSIGNVFAKELCIFDANDAGKIVKVIEDYTHPIRDNWFNRIIEWLREI